MNAVKAIASFSISATKNTWLKTCNCVMIVLMDSSGFNFKKSSDIVVLVFHPGSVAAKRASALNDNSCNIQQHYTET